MTRIVDLAQIYTEAVRHITPRAAAKNLACSFDYQGARVMLASSAQSLRCGLHRLFSAVVDATRSGFLTFDASVRLQGPHQCQVTWTVLISGTLVPEDVEIAVMQRLALVEQPGGPSPTGHRRAFGRCPKMGAALSFHTLPDEGAVFFAEQVFTIEAHLEDEDATLNAGLARAWVIDSDDVTAGALVLRLQRQGWATTRFDGLYKALAEARSRDPTSARPALVIAVQSDDVLFDEAQALAALLPSWTRSVYAAPVGSDVLTLQDISSLLDIMACPFSPAELEEWTLSVSPERDVPSGHTSPMPLSLDHRAHLLVVDERTVHRIVATAMSKVLGYVADTPMQGLGVVEHCKRWPPDVVLIDVNAPTMSGLCETRQLKVMQSRGDIPPFPILVSSADASADFRQACLRAGADGFVPKPLLLPVLKQELLRVGVPVPRQGIRFAL